MLPPRKAGAPTRVFRYATGVTRAELVRKLRSLRRMERRVRGGEDGPTTVWDGFFSVTDGARVRYPLGILLVLDRASRERAFREYLVALWADGADLVPDRDRDVLDALGLPPGSAPADVRAAFREAARELHPDLGGDEDLVRELIEKYRRSSYGTRGPG